jgi:NADH:ubiquinone oxidoreductase subunit 4 (subunit M)
MLLVILFILFQIGSTELQILLTIKFSEQCQILLWIVFFGSYSIKVPMITFHIWLLKTHVEAPMTRFVILVGILFKLRTYGF